MKIIRSLTLDNNRNQQPYRQPENECFYAKDRENEFFNTYQINLNVYSLYGYTSTMDQYLQRLAHNSLKYTEKIYLKFDLLFILKGMIKSFMFNELELVFLSYFLEENKWDYISCFSEANKLNELPEKFQTHYEIEKPLEYKALILYLMYSCMAIKQIFRENNETFMFFAFVSKILEDFPLDFNEWRKKNQDFLIFEPLRLNTVFEKNSFSWNGLEETFTQTQNLDIMVNKILEMSPPYLYEKSDITYSKKNMDFEFPSTYDIKSGFFLHFYFWS